MNFLKKHFPTFIREYHKICLWSWSNIRMYIFFCFFILMAILFICSIKSSFLQEYIDSKASIVSFIALGIAFFALSINEKFSIFLDSIVGLKAYTRIAARSYRKAQDRIIGALHFWAVTSYLEDGLLNTKCPNIKFVGNIELDERFPGVLWRWWIGQQRKNGNFKNEIEIYHKDNCYIRFVIVDSAVLIEKIVGSQFFGTFEYDEDISQEYVWIYELLYGNNSSTRSCIDKDDEVVSLKDRIFELLREYISIRFDTSRPIDIPNLIKAIGRQCMIGNVEYAYFKKNDFDNILGGWIAQMIDECDNMSFTEDRDHFIIKK